MLHTTLARRCLSHPALPRRPPPPPTTRTLARLSSLSAACQPDAPMAPDQPEWAAARVRQTFLDYFTARGHTFGTQPAAPAA